MGVRLRLNKEQIFKLSDIISDVGLIALATVVLPALFDKYDQNKLTLGLVTVIVCWLGSLLLRK